MSPIEALADAIMAYNEWIPKGASREIPNGSRSWRNRNPGNLRAYTASHMRDKEGYRVFASLTDGFQALIADIHLTLNTEFFMTKKLIDLLDKYFLPMHITFVCYKLTLALTRPIISEMSIINFLNHRVQSLSSSAS